MTWGPQEDSPDSQSDCDVRGTHPPFDKMSQGQRPGEDLFLQLLPSLWGSCHTFFSLQIIVSSLLQLHSFHSLVVLSLQSQLAHPGSAHPSPDATQGS